jgi:toxoflavin synthase
MSDATEDQGARAEYDSIGVSYENIKRIPLTRYVERFTFLGQVGDVTGKSVLDLACGAGFYSRIFAHNGAARVVGVDLSPVMIEAAREREAAEPLGIAYHVADVANLPDLGTYDLVTSAFLLNYAPDDTTLRNMCLGIARSLASGGEFVYIGCNPWYDLEGPGQAKYGVTVTPIRRVADGTEATVTAHLDPPLSFVNYFLGAGVYERALREAGFREHAWIPVAVPPEGFDEFGIEFWQDALANPVLIALRARL